MFICFLPSLGYTGSSNGGDPHRTSANRGENVILRCAFDFPDGFRVPYVIQWEKVGNKIPIYIWYDGYPPHIGEGYEGRVSLTGQASLNLSTVQEDDQGWYECKVFFLNRPPEPIKNGTRVHLEVLGTYCREYVSICMFVTPSRITWVLIGIFSYSERTH